MIVNFTELNQFNTPEITLCNPDSYIRGGVQIANTIGLLKNSKNLDCNYNFNSYLEGSFTYSRMHSDNEIEEEFLSNLFNSIENDRYLFIENVGFMVISNVDDKSKFLEQKEVQFTSCDKELEFCDAPFISTEETKTGTINYFLDLWLNCCPMWDLGYISGDLRYDEGSFGELNRTITNITSQDARSFLINEIQDAFDCIVDFDYIYRKVNIYSHSDFKKQFQTDILVSEHLLNDIIISGNYDNSYTALEVGGDSNDSFTEIRMVNPIGNNIVYNFSSKLDWMLPSLRAKVEQWENVVKENMEIYYKLSPAWYQAQEYLENVYQDYLVVKGNLEEHTLAYNNALNSTTTDEDAKNALLTTLQNELSIDCDGGYRQFDISRIVVSKIPQNQMEWGYDKLHYYLSGIDGTNGLPTWTYIDSYDSWVSLSKITPLYVVDNLDFEKQTYYIKNSSGNFVETTKSSWNKIDTLYTYFNGIHNYGELVSDDYKLSTSWLKYNNEDSIMLNAFLESKYQIGEDEIKYSYEQLKQQVLSINDRCSLSERSGIFGTEDLIQLSNYIKIGTYSNQHVVNTEGMSYQERVENEKRLMNRVSEKLTSLNENAKKVSIDVKSFIFDIAFKHFAEQLRTGCIINVELSNNLIEQFYLANFSINYENKTLSFTLGNKYNKFDIKSLFDEVLGDISKSTHQINNLQKRVSQLEKTK